jgi:hypothetical protein
VIKTRCRPKDGNAGRARSFGAAQDGSAAGRTATVRLKMKIRNLGQERFEEISVLLRRLNLLDPAGSFVKNKRARWQAI